MAPSAVQHFDETLTCTKLSLRRASENRYPLFRKHSGPLCCGAPVTELSTASLPHPCAAKKIVCYKCESNEADVKRGDIMRARFKNDEGIRDMGLKAPSIITFMISVVLTVVVLMSSFFGAEIPGLKDNEQWALLLSYGILMLGCLVKGL